MRLGYRIVVATAVGLAVGVMVALCAKGSYFWPSIGIGLAVGVFMGIGEELPDESPEEFSTGRAFHQ